VTIETLGIWDNSPPNVSPTPARSRSDRKAWQRTSLLTRDYLAALDWDFADAAPARDRHAIVGYPAKFIPELPRQLIRELSEPGDLVLDPFTGGGTTQIEAARLDRPSVGVDASRWAVLVARVKSSTLSPADLHSLDHLLASLIAWPDDDSRKALPGPTITNREKWYSDEVFAALVGLREAVCAIDDERARNVALVAFAQVASRSSFQESEARYVSAPRKIDPSRLPMDLAKEVARIRTILIADRSVNAAEIRVIEGDSASELHRIGMEDSVALVVTSPPYPNAYDYHLYQRFRLLWLDADPGSLRKVEIGSHLRGQSDKRPQDRYLTEMAAVLERIHAVLRPGKYAALIVGDGVYRGERFQTSAELSRIASELGFTPLLPISRKLHSQRRAIGVGRRLVSEDILLIRKPRKLTRVRLAAPSYAMKDYEHLLLAREVQGLASTGFLRSAKAEFVADVEAAEAEHLARVAFASSIVEDSIQPTAQWVNEGKPAPGDRRKSSTYLSHGLHRFAGKFYPQLAKAMINAAGVRPGDTVLDPFGGSGTTSLECSLAGVESWSIDCSPLATAITCAKRAALDIAPVVLADAAEEVVSQAKRGANGGQLGQGSAACRAEVVAWFSPNVLAKLDSLVSCLGELKHPDVALIFRILVSDLLREVSHQDPRDLRIRRRADPPLDAPVFELFVDRAYELAHRLRAVELPRFPGDVHARCADSSSDLAYAELDNMGHVDAVVTSPPYASALPYVDTDRLSLVSLFGLDTTARRGLERSLIGTRELTSREAAVENERTALASRLPTTTQAFLSAYAGAIAADPKAGFRLQRSPAVLGRYFRSISEVFRQISLRMEAGANVYWVVGDSTSSVANVRWLIPTVSETTRIAETHGFALTDSISISVTRKDLVHSRHAITRNEILHFTRRG
jgi:DNA modification methylase